MDISMILFIVIITSMLSAITWVGVLTIYEKTILPLYRRTLRYEAFPDTAVVCNKEYDENYSKVASSLTYNDEGYNVYVMYDDKEYCFNGKDLYEQINVSDNLHVMVYNGYNKKNTLKYTYLSIED